MTGSRATCRAATARQLQTARADAALADYVSRRPRSWARFKNILENTPGTEVSEHNTRLPMVERRVDRTRE
jgi:hypothetical protein